MCATKVQPPSTGVHHPSILQTRGCHLCNPSHSRMGGMHPCHLDPLTETSRGGSSPMSPSIWKCYKDFTDVFSEEAFAHLPPCKAWDHTIELHPDAKLPRGRMFPLSPTEQKELDEFLRENLVNRCIHPSKSPIGTPVFFIKKKEGSLRLVQDYQKLNKIMVKNSYPLPLVSDVLTRLRDAEWFTTLDLHWGFNNV